MTCGHVQDCKCVDLDNDNDKETCIADSSAGAYPVYLAFYQAVTYVDCPYGIGNGGGGGNEN